MLYLNRQDGQTLIEYAFILVLVAIVVLLILTILGAQVGNMFSQITSSLDPVT